MLWLSRRSYSLNTCNATAHMMKKFAVGLLDDGVNSFCHLSFERIEEWILCGATKLDFRMEETYSCLNKLVIEKSGLPFMVVLQKKLNAVNFCLTYKEAEQYIVLPPRLYFHALNTSAALIEELYAYIDELGSLSQLLVLKFDNYSKHIHKRGEISYLIDYKGDDDFKAAFYAMESPTEKEVLTLAREHQPAIISAFQGDITDVSFKGGTLTSAEATALLRDYMEHCKFLLLALTGMRLDELSALHWYDGIDTDTIEGQEVCTLRADMSKTTGNSQARQDTFVTTEVGKKAYEVLNEIMTPFRNTQKSSQQGFFHRITSDFSLLQKGAVSRSFTTWFTIKYSTELTLDTDDMKCLSISDPKQHVYKLGDTFHVSPHQLRRIFAYYLVGYELLSFPQLKQQFSHYSIAMTRYYAKNASKFQKWHKSTYDAINDERVTQQSQIYLNIYQKLANNERVAGGKGKAFAKQMLSGNKENLFTDRTSNDMLSLAYWENAIRKKKRHLHVVAPGVICISTSCSMRTSVSFLDCVDCDNDYVIDAVFAEANRKSAEINMLYDIEHGELTTSSATESYKKIIAAQHIMKDLDVAYDPVVFPPEVKDILVTFVEL
jgi:integrase